jgi:hypothetical protein
MEKIILISALAVWLVAGISLGLIGKKNKLNFWIIFAVSLFLTPIGGAYLLLKDNNGSSQSRKHRKHAPWNELIRKAENAVAHEDYTQAREFYQKALEILQDPESESRHYYKKYILSKTSEVKYSLSILEGKKDKQVSFNPNSSNPFLDTRLSRRISDTPASSAG